VDEWGGAVGVVERVHRYSCRLAELMILTKPFRSGVIGAQISLLWDLSICSDLDTVVQAAARAVRGSVFDFCLTHIFFFFLVGRNSANFASARPRKLFAGYRLVSGSGAKLSEFRLGGCAKLVPGGALFGQTLQGATSDVQNCPHIQLDN
jgi:hypothetical protein